MNAMYGTISVVDRELNVGRQQIRARLKLKKQSLCFLLLLCFLIEDTNENRFLNTRAVMESYIPGEDSMELYDDLGKESQSLDW